MEEDSGQLIEPMVSGSLDEQIGAILTQATRSGDRSPAQLAPVDTAGGIIAWKNPTGKTIIIDELLLRIINPSSIACTADFGVAADGVTTSNNLINGLSLAAAGMFDNVANGGTNGKKRQVCTANQWVTGSMASGATAGLSGQAYIRYFQVG